MSFSLHVSQRCSGFDLQFGTNVLGHFYFTTGLLPVLKAAAQSLSPEDRGDVRVVNVASSATYMYASKKDLMWNTLKDGPARRKTSTRMLYSQVRRYDTEDVPKD